jgi:hypothetical protein
MSQKYTFPIHSEFASATHYPEPARLTSLIQTIVEGGVWIATSSLPVTLAVVSVFGR